MAVSSVENLIPEIENLAQKKVARYRLPGLALGLVCDQELVYAGGFGSLALGVDRRPDRHTIARVASVTKTFTTTAIMQLRDENRLQLDDPLVEHIPEFSRVAARQGCVEGVTIRRLLTHRSGLVTEPPVAGWGALQFPSMEEILQHLPQTEIVISQDAAWKYSNLGFGLLGQVVQRLSGMPYVDYIRTHITEPLGLNATVFELTDALRPHFFTGYNPPLFQDHPETASNAHLHGLSAAGQLHSTVNDLAKWVAFQFCADGGERHGTQVLDGRSLAQMHRPQYMEDDWSAGQCLGWRATRVGDRVYHNHGGGIHGFGTQVWFNLPAKVGAIVLINMWPPPGGLDLVQEVLELVLGQLNKAPAPEKPQFKPVPAPLQRFLGHYCAAPGIHANIEYRDGSLRLQANPGYSYSLHAPAVLEATDKEGEWRVRGGRGAGETAVFRFAEDGRVLGYDLGAFVFKKYALAQ
jgi:CubicO group peptidase (beta-lactamase class C family)